jgi:hypothetical protein
MRHLLLVLMIALLPVRGWIGDAMATGMAAGHLQHQQAATEFIAVHAHETGADEHFDHAMPAPEAMHAEAAAPDCADRASHGKNDHAADAHCDSCAACQACHTVALSPAAAGLNPVFQALTLRRPAPDQFASADAALRQKPPIS